MYEDDSKTVLEDALSGQKIRDGDSELQALRERRDQVETALRSAFGSKPKIRYAGSIAKSTLIRSAYDLDLTCYFDAGDNTAWHSLQEIYEHTRRALSKSFEVTAQRSALRVTSKDGSDNFHVDVIPGRFTDESRTEAYLYQAEGKKSRLKTNVEAHLAHVRDSGQSDVISLFKLWSRARQLPIKTFALELAVIDALRGEPSSDLEDRVETVLAAFRHKIDNIKVEDPPTQRAMTCLTSGTRMFAGPCANRLKIRSMPQTQSTRYHPTLIESFSLSPLAVLPVTRSVGSSPSNTTASRSSTGELPSAPVSLPGRFFDKRL